MTMTFYPHEDDLETSNLEEKLEVLMDAAERYKAVILDGSNIRTTAVEGKKIATPRDTVVAFNWEAIAKLLRETRDLPEGNAAYKLAKSQNLLKLAEVYEVLRGAKMPKLEAVRLALINEANQLKGGMSQTP